MVDHTVRSNSVGTFLLYPGNKSTSRSNHCRATVSADTHKFSHLIPLLSKNVATTWNTSSALAGVSRGLQNSISSSIEDGPTKPTTETIGQHQLFHHTEQQKKVTRVPFKELDTQYASRAH